jgi:hypothetical protein
MSSRLGIWVLLLLSGIGLGALQAAGVSEQQADAFSQKMATVKKQGIQGISGVQGTNRTLRTPFSESELNSWFAYRSGEVMPPGVSEPRVTLVGNGKVKAVATVDLEAIAKQRSSGRALDPWSYLGGRLPVTLSGVLRTENGMGRFDLEEAAISGVPVPTSVLADIVSYYTRTAADSEGVRINDDFRLPSQIKQIEMGAGQGVIVQ